jgi:4-amino-4-deoxy-L-arabinose transferase-like glycosyltransferase
MKNGRGALLLLLLAGAIVLVAGLGLREPWPADEPRFALIAKDMVASGDWLIPRVGGVLYPDKPPLFFWLVASCYLLTGSINVAFLLPSLLAGLGVLWLVYDLSRRLRGPRTALAAGAALLATLQFPLQMKAGQIDGVLCFWTTLGLYGLSRHLLLGPDWRWCTIAGAACGLGVITKGVGFLPLLVFLPWACARYRRWPLPALGWRGGRWLLTPAAFAVAIALWLLPMLIVTTGSGDPDLLQYRDNILLKQTVTRYAAPWGHLKPPWYLLTNAVSWLWLPLTFLLPWLIPAWIRDLKARRAATLLFGGWVLLVLLFFSLSGGKRSVYILPALPALVLLAAPHLERLLTLAGPRRVLFALSLSLALLVHAGGLQTLADPAALREWLADPAQAASLSWIAIGTGALAVALTFGFGRQRAAAGFGAVMATLWLSVSFLVYPRIDSTRSGQAIVDAARTELAPGDSLGFAGWKEQLLLQWNRPAVHFGYRRNDDAGESRDAAAWLSEDSGHRLLLPDDLVSPCYHRAQLTELGFAHRHHWFLASGHAVLPVCSTAAPGTSSQNRVYYDPSQPRDTAGSRHAGDPHPLKTATPPRETAPAATTFPHSPGGTRSRPHRLARNIRCSRDSRGCTGWSLRGTRSARLSAPQSGG